MQKDKPGTIKQCKSCQADIIWSKSAKSMKNMPMDATPEGDGKFVMFLRDSELLAEHYFPSQHAPERRRYSCHYDTCPSREKTAERTDTPEVPF